MRFILILFFLSFLFQPTFLKAQNYSIPSVNIETELSNNQLSKSALKRIKFINNIGLFSVADTLIGAVNKKGNIVIPSVYKNIYKEGSTFVLQNSSNEFHFFVNGNKLLTPLSCDSFVIKPTLIIYSVNKKWGAYILHKGNIEDVKPIYKNIDVLNGTLILTEYSNSWNVRNGDSSYCCILADTMYFQDEYLLYKRNGLAGLIDEEGNEITKAIYHSIDSTDLQRIRSEQLNYLPYDSTQPFYSNHDNSVYELMDSTSVAVGTLKHYNFFKRIDYGNLKIVGKSNLFGVFDFTKDSFIVSVKHTTIIPEIDEKIFLVYDTLKFSIIDFDGIVLSEPHIRFDTVFEFHEGRAKFLKAGKLGFIDRRGNVRVAPQYKTLRDFHNGAAAVFLNGKWGFIDNDEAILVQPLYDEVIDFQNNIAAVRKGKVWYFVKKNGEESSNIKYDSVKYSGNKYWLVYKDKKVGLVDIAGREKLGARYDAVFVCNELVAVKKFNKWGIVDLKENTIVPIEYDFIDCNRSIFILMKRNNGARKELKYDN